MAVSTYTEAIEQAHKKQLLADTKRASELGLNTYEFRSQRKAAVERWTTVIRELMDQANVSDPASVLPEIAARIIEDTAQIAREEAEVTARHTVQKMFRKVAAP
jgi:hypothetical protein